MPDKPDVTPPTKPAEKPDNTLPGDLDKPGDGGRPDQGLPGDRPKPDQGLPGSRAAAKETKAYRLRQDVGPHFGADGKLVQPGDVALLTETQFVAFGDKFEDAGASR